MTKINISTTIKGPVSTVWEYWTHPKHITGWAFASEKWECPKAENDVRVGGQFTTTMAAKDGSASFDIIGVYSVVEPEKHIVYTMEDGREVITEFTSFERSVQLTQQFDPESENSVEVQRQGWQAILDNFKKYTERVR